MKWSEKIRQMNDDELAEFISKCDSDEGFVSIACSKCPHLKNEWECDSDILSRDCMIAVKNCLKVRYRMESLKRHKRDSRAYRDYQKFMVDVLNLMARAYAVELHDTYGFGAARLSELTDNAIKSVHAAIARYDGEFAETALEVQCKRFNFDPRIRLNSEGAVRFVGGAIEKTKGKTK